MQFAKPLRRTFTALAVQSSSFSKLHKPSITTSLVLKPQHLRRPSSFTGVSLSSSSFDAPEPPACKGDPVFKDILLSQERSEDAKMREKDEGAVFVVTGASRGIGLEMVKQLVDSTEVCRIKYTESKNNNISPASNYTFNSFKGFHRSMLSIAGESSQFA